MESSDRLPSGLSIQLLNLPLSSENLATQRVDLDDE